MVLGMVAIRMPGYLHENAMACAAPSTGCVQNPRRGISMFDCPEANHTSPMSMSLIVTVSRPDAKRSVCGSNPASPVGISSLQRPSFPAFALMGDSGAQLPTASTRAPGAALPHMRALLCCWSTMWSEKMSGSLSSAPVAIIVALKAAINVMNGFICYIISFVLR